MKRNQRGDALIDGGVFALSILPIASSLRITYKALVSRPAESYTTTTTTSSRLVVQTPDYVVYCIRTASHSMEARTPAASGPDRQTPSPQPSNGKQLIQRGVLQCFQPILCLEFHDPRHFYTRN